MSDKWIERLELSPVPSGILRHEWTFDAPYGAEFIGVQHDATILVMLVQGWVVEHFEKHGKATERRTVIRVKDKAKVSNEHARYIGSNGQWHLFELLNRREKKDE